VTRTVLLYGLLGGLLLAVLQLLEYRLLVVEHALGIYGGLVALLFAALGCGWGAGTDAPTRRWSCTRWCARWCAR
jgi:hypothetical protein